MFFKGLIITVALIWFVGLVVRATFARWLRRKTEEYNRAAQAAQKEARRQARGHREGQITVENTRPAEAKRVASGVGEYVSFEDIKE